MRRHAGILGLLLVACTGGSIHHQGNPDLDGGEVTADASASSSPDAGPKVCPAVPARAEASPPTIYSGACSYMDWDLSSDGFYIISEFGTTADPSTIGHNTSCGALQYHYATECCLFDIDSDRCLDADASGARKTRKFQATRGAAADQCHVADVPETGPPEVIAATRTSNYWYNARSIDWSYDAVVAQVKGYFFDDAGNPLPRAQADAFPHPDYFYVAGAQRFGCDAYLRVSNLATGRCIVAYADDGGPGSRYEMAGYGGRRILDSSPAVNTYLGSVGIGWASGDLVLVEWALPGDRPGLPCTPCQGEPAAAGSETQRSPFDLADGFRGSRACRADALTLGDGLTGGTPVVPAP